MPATTCADPAAAGLAAAAGLLRLALHVALEAEIAAACDAAPYQRGAARRARRGGTAPRTCATPLGTLQLRVPRLASGGFRSAMVPRDQRALDRLAAPALRLAAGVNSWAAAQALVEPLRQAHGDAAWIARTARRILERCESTRHPDPPAAIALLSVRPLCEPAEAATLGLHSIVARPGDGSPDVVWLTPIDGPPAWHALAARLHARGAQRVARIDAGGDAACCDAVRARWPLCRPAASDHHPDSNGG